MVRSFRSTFALAGVGAVMVVGSAPTAHAASKAPEPPMQAQSGLGPVFGTTPSTFPFDRSSLPLPGRLVGRDKDPHPLLRPGATDKDRSPLAERVLSRTLHRNVSRAQAWTLLRKNAADALDAQPTPAPELGKVDRVVSPYAVALKLDPAAAADRKVPERGIFISSMPIAIPPKADSTKDLGSLADSTLVTRDGRLEQKNAVEGVTLPKAADGVATLEGTGVSVDLVDGAQTGAKGTSVETKDAVAWYGEVLPSTDLAVKALPTGFETVHNLRGSDAPEDFDVPLTVPKDAKLRLLTEKERDGSDTNTAAVVEQGDEVLMAISAAVAYDADGRTVPVQMTVDRDRLRMHVEHRGTDVKYPIALDPSYTHDYDSSTSADRYVGISNYSSKPSWFSPTFGISGQEGLFINAPASNSSITYENGNYAGFSMISQAEPTGPTTLHPEGGFIYQMNAYKVTYGAVPDVPNFPGPYEPILMAGLLDRNQYAYNIGGGTQANQVTADTSIGSSTNGPLVRTQRALNGYFEIRSAYDTSPNYTASPFAATVGNAATFRLVKSRASQEVNVRARLGWYGLLASDRGAPFWVQGPGDLQQWLDRTAGTFPVRAHDYGYGIAAYAIFDDGNELLLNQSSCFKDAAGNGQLGPKQCAWDNQNTLPVSSLPVGKAAYEGIVYDGAGYLARQPWTLRVDKDKPTVDFATSQQALPVRPNAPADEPNQPKARRTINVTGTDDASGFKSFTVKVDGVERNDLITQPTCTVDNCARTMAETVDSNGNYTGNGTALTISAAGLTDGLHTISVTARDNVSGTGAQNHVSDTKTTVVQVYNDPQTTPVVPTIPPGEPDDFFGRPLEPGLGFENFWAYDTTDTGADSKLRVNLANGNTLWSLTPVTNPGIGANTFLRLTYNSQDRPGLLPTLAGLDPGVDGIGGYGVGGRNVSVQLGGFTRLNERLEIRGPGGLQLAAAAEPRLTTAIVMTDGDGTQHKFPRIGDPNDFNTPLRFASPPGVELEFRRYWTGAQNDPEHNRADRYWAATRPDGTTAFFDREGYITQVRDRHDQGLTFQYDDVALRQRAGCGYSLECKRVTRVYDTATKSDPNDAASGSLYGVPANEEAAKTARSWNLTYNDDGRLTGVQDRKLISGQRRLTSLTYDTKGRLETVTRAANAPENQQQKYRLGYLSDGTTGTDDGSAYLRSVTDPKDQTTQIRYAASPSAFPLLGGILQTTGLERDIRLPTVIRDRSASTDQRSKTFRFQTPEPADANHKTWVRNDDGPTKPDGSGADDIVDEYDLDVYGRLIATTNGVDDTTTTTQNEAAPSPRRSSQVWTDDNYVASSTQALEDTTKTKTVEYCWGDLGQLRQETEHGGTASSSDPCADRSSSPTQRVRKWTYRVHNGTLKTGSDIDSGLEKQFVYDVESETDRNGDTTTYEYANAYGGFGLPTVDPNIGDLRSLIRPGGRGEYTAFTPRGLPYAHAVFLWNGSRPTFNQNETPYDYKYEFFGTFDGNGDWVQHYDPRGRYWYNLRDSVGNLEQIWDPRILGDQQLSQNTAEKIAATSDDPVATLTDGGQSAPRVTAKGQGTAFVARWTYDALDRKVASAIPKRSGYLPNTATPVAADRFRVTATSYDRNGNAIKSMDGEGKVGTRTFTPTDQIADESSPQTPHHKGVEEDGAADQNTDGAPQVAAAAAEKTSYEYDQFDRLVKRTDPLGQRAGVTGHRTEWTYDRFDEPITQARVGASPVKTGDPAITKITTSRAYDARGNVIGETDGNRNAEATAPDAASNAATDPGRRTRYDYDVFDRVTAAVENPDGTGDDRQLQTDYGYDYEDRQTSTTTPAGRTTKRYYNEVGELIKQEDPFAFNLDGTDRLARTTSKATTTYQRRLDGQIYAITTPRGVATTGDGEEAEDFTTRMARDEEGNLTARSIPRAVGQYGDHPEDWKVTYTLDAVGDATEIKDARTKTLTNQYLDTGELRSTTRPGFWIYDQSTGKLRERTDEDPAAPQIGDSDLPDEPGTGDFGKTSQQQMPDFLPPAGYTEIEYDDELRVTKITGQDDDSTTQTPKLLQQQMTYDPTGRLIKRSVPFTRVSGGSPTTIEMEWRYDRNGNTRAMIDGRNQATIYRYDDFDRQISTTEPENCDSTITGCQRPKTSQTLDRNDNVTTVDTPLSANPAITVPNNQPPDRTTGKQQLTYDRADRMLTEIGVAGTKEQHVYDPDGQITKDYRPRAFASVSTTTPNEQFATTYQRDGAGRVTRESSPVTDPGTPNLITKTEYDLEGNPTTITSPGARSESGTGDVPDRIQERRYDGRNLPWATTIGTGSAARTTVTEYDANGWLRRTVNPKAVTGHGDTAQATYPDTTSTTPLDTNATRHAELRTYNDDGLLTTRNLPWDQASDKASDDSARKRWRQDYEYSPRGMVNRITEIYNRGTGTGRENHATVITRNAAGWPTSTDERNWKGGPENENSGQTIEFGYDKQGNQTRWQTPGRQRKILRGFYPSGQQRYRCGVRTAGTGPGVDANEQVYSFRYDTSGALTRTTDWMHYAVQNGTTQCTETAAPENDDDKDPNNGPRRTQITRDRAGRPSVVDETWSSGKDTKYTYVPNSPTLVKTLRTDGIANGVDYTAGTNNSSPFTTTTYDYDEVDRNTQVVTKRSGSTTERTTDIKLWPSGERRELQKPTTGSGRTTESRYYDTTGKLKTRTVNPASGTTKTIDYSYDENGNRAVDDRGRSTYNARNQMTKWERIRRKTNGDAIPEATDADGYTAPTEKNPKKTTTYELAGDGRQLEVEDTTIAPQGGNSVTTVTKTVNTYNGDEVERAKREITATGPAVRGASSAQTDCYQYNAFRSLSATRRITSSPKTNTTTGVGETASMPSVSSDCSGMPGKVEVQYTYDTFERMTAGRERKHQANEAENDDGQLDGTQAYCYDGLDRRDKRITGLPTGQDPGEGNGDAEQLTRARAACTTAVSGGSVHTYDYSYLGTTEQLTRENRPSGVQTYEYTANGTRLGRLKNADNASNDREWRAYDTDAQGTVVGLEKPDTGNTEPDADGKLNTYDTDPYGGPVVAEGANLSEDAQGNPFRFQGFYKDQDTGTYDMQARSYRPELGRFLQQDRYADPGADLQLAADPLSNSRYAFLAGNPSTYAEYNGHEVCDWTKPFDQCDRVGDSENPGPNAPKREKPLTRSQRYPGASAPPTPTPARKRQNALGVGGQAQGTAQTQSAATARAEAAKPQSGGSNFITRKINTVNRDVAEGTVEGVKEGVEGVKAIANDPEAFAVGTWKVLTTPEGAKAFIQNIADSCDGGNAANCVGRWLPSLLGAGSGFGSARFFASTARYSQLQKALAGVRTTNLPRGWRLKGGEFENADRSIRIAPLGNPTRTDTDAYKRNGILPAQNRPHYHRRVENPDGSVVPGQGARRHRPWETKDTDAGFSDRF